MSNETSVMTSKETQSKDPGTTAPKRGGPSCRFCAAPLSVNLVDLGMSPLCESYLAADQVNTMEPFYPLHVYVCGQCYLAQLEEYVQREHIFREYAYFSSYSDSWLNHARKYTDLMTKRFDLSAKS